MGGVESTAKYGQVGEGLGSQIKEKTKKLPVLTF